MNENPLVSIVITNYNYGRFLKESIESALSQTYKNVEVIVVDDGSTDNSANLIDLYADNIISVFKKNGGQGSAFNEGYKRSSGVIIIFLDADDILMPQAVENVVSLFDEKTSAVHWKLEKINSEGIRTGIIVPQQPLPEGDLLEQLIGYGPEHWKDGCSPLPAGHAYAKKLLDSILPLPEEKFKSGADYYLFALSPLFGLSKKIESPLSLYRVHGANDTSRPLEQYIEKFMAWFETTCNSLEKLLSKFQIDVETNNWKTDSWYHKIDASLKQINNLVSEGGCYILADNNQWMANQQIAGRHIIPFTEKDGQFWGEPSNDDEAIAEIERQRARGAGHIFFTWNAFWMLEHYTKMQKHLETKYRKVCSNNCLTGYQLNCPEQIPINEDASKSQHNN